MQLLPPARADKLPVAPSDGSETLERILGIGGVFFKARDPITLTEWYRQHLGIPVEMGQTYGTFTSAASG
jgi:hypothetical protein